MGDITYVLIQSVGGLRLWPRFAFPHPPAVGDRIVSEVREGSADATAPSFEVPIQRVEGLVIERRWLTGDRGWLCELTLDSHVILSDVEGDA